MGKITATIAQGIESYGAWANEVAGVYGEGATIEEAAKRLLEGLRLYKQHNASVPAAIADDVEIEYVLEDSPMSLTSPVARPQRHREPTYA